MARFCFLVVCCGVIGVAAGQTRETRSPLPSPTAGPTPRREELAFPTGDRATSMVLLERFFPAEVRRGEEFAYEIRLTNLTRARLADLVVVEQPPPGMRLTGITPEPGRNERGSPQWGIRELPAGATQVIKITGSTDQPAELTGCAAVTFSLSSCSTTQVVEPQLSLTKSMPPEVVLCEEIPIRLKVTNTGSGVARGVKVTDTLPAGLTLSDGNNTFVFELGDLPPGQSRDLSVGVRATRPGDYRNTAVVAEAGGLRAEASASTVVRQPALTLQKTAPNVRYLGRTAEFDLVVQNTGNAPARDTVLVDAVPPGLEVVSTDAGGRMVDGRMTWSLGTLSPGASARVHLVTRAAQIGRFTNTATVRAFCAEASATATVEVLGIPAILLEVVDLDDPIEIGGQVTYEIAVTNQGSATGTNITLECTLPPEEEYVSGTGPTPATAQGKTIRFAALATLAPQVRVVYKLVVRAGREGDVRFKVSMKSDQTETPVEETESTRLY